MSTQRKGQFGPTIGSQVVGPQELKASAAGAGLTGGAGTALAVNPGAGLEIVADAVAVKYGTEAGTAAQGNDARLSDARAPTDASVTPAKMSGNAGTYVCAAIANFGGAQATQTRYVGVPTGDILPLSTSLDADAVEANSRQEVPTARKLVGLAVKLALDNAQAGSIDLRKNNADVDDVNNRLAVGAGAASGWYDVPIAAPVSYGRGSFVDIEINGAAGGVGTIAVVGIAARWRDD